MARGTIAGEPVRRPYRGPGRACGLLAKVGHTRWAGSLNLRKILAAVTRIVGVGKYDPRRPASSDAPQLEVPHVQEIEKEARKP